MTKIWETGKLFIKELDILDCAIFCDSHGIIGSSWHVNIEIEGQLDENGFVYDFSHTKKLVKETLKKTLDHALILPESHPSIKMNTQNDVTHLEINQHGEKWTYTCPEAAIYTVSNKEVNAESVARAAEKAVISNLPATVKAVRIDLCEESISDGSSIFRYTHGLPNHQGLCQRLFHGHRSKIVVLENGKKSPEKEMLIAEQWFSGRIHIAEPGQLKSQPWDLYSTGPKGEQVHLLYEAQEGEFEGTIPAEKVFLVEQATSIESIARGLCKALKGQFPKSNFTVIPHEGINKGGIASI
jgi:6-pyruvoyl-tetrahydropterin synthase